ncbi:MAG: hypothetical protein QXK26_04205, partial [Candidatus Bathyarchaeia archaeon]
MTLKFNSKIAKNKEDRRDAESLAEDLIGYLDIKKWGAPEGYVEVETYPLKPPFSYACIVQN